MIHYISAERLTLQRVQEIMDKKMTLALSEETKAIVQKCRNYLDEKMKTQKEPIYGISTGFGSLYNVNIEKDQLSQLQKNLVMSHACGIGEEVPADIVKLMLLFKIQSLSYGYSGVQLVTLQRLVDFYNEDVLPVVYQQGSLGASGDLAPLAHLCLPLLGMGDVRYKGEKMDASVANAKFGWESITLQSKEGLALLNGTQFMASFAAWNVLRAQRLSKQADMIMAMSLDAFDGRIEPFYDEVHFVRPHKGQLDTARTIRKYMEGSELIKRHKEHVQDPYSFRCVPQVHGAAKDSIAYVAGVVETEINSATDNPTVFPDQDMVISAGNFHGQPLALVMDFLAIAVSELGNISERRTYQLIDGKRGLPNFLVAKPGLNSGFMIPQYAAAAIVSQTKIMCMPNSADSIPSSQGQEDHVSMGANAATKCYRVVNNVERVLGIELLNAAQALEFRRPLKSSPFIEEMLADFRKVVAFVDDDRIMYTNIHRAGEFLQAMNVE